MSAPYNPLENQQLAESVVRALIERPCEELPPPRSFEGPGIYAIYYRGDFAPYASISVANAEDCELPIYAGRARLSGARKGRSSGVGETPLYGRLSEHADSVEAATNLDVEHFRCRHLVVEEIWVPLAERLLLERYQPLWNRVIDGFGNHDPGSGRRNQRRSPWDVVHPGRAWAESLQPGRNSVGELTALIKAHFGGKHEA